MDSCSKFGFEDVVEDINPNSEKAKNRSIITHVVKKGEILQRVASKYHVTIKELMVWNNLKAQTLKYGQKLSIWRDDAQKNEDKKIASTVSPVAKFPKSRKNTYQVQPGDTLWSISQKLDLSVKILKKLNKLRSDQVKPGQKLLLG